MLSWLSIQHVVMVVGQLRDLTKLSVKDGLKLDSCSSKSSTIDRHKKFGLAVG